MYFRINFFSFARATSNNYRRNLLLSSSPSSSRYFTRNLRKSSQTERQHTTPHRSFWCKDVVRLHVALLNVPMNRISQFLTSRKLGLSFPLLLNQTYVHRDPRGLLFTPTASLKLLRPIFRNSGAYLASQNPIWLNRRFSTGTEPPKTDEKIPKYEIIQKKELPSLGFPTQRKVYNDPNNIVLPGYNADAPVAPKLPPPPPEIWEKIPTSLLLLILVLILCLEYVFFMLEPQLREAARLEELRNITARKQLESSPSLATIAVEEKPSASKGASADEPQIDPQMLKKIEQTLCSYPIVVFMKGTPEKPRCKYSAQLVKLLQSHHVDFVAVDILSEDAQLRRAVRTYSHWPSFPQLYVQKQFVGGVDVVQQLDEAHSLDEILDPARAEIRKLSFSPSEERKANAALSSTSSSSSSSSSITLRDFSELKLSENVSGCM